MPYKVGDDYGIAGTTVDAGRTGGTMEIISVHSSAIRAIGYDGYTLAVQFHNSGVYYHPGVPYEVYAALMAASSIGAYYNRHIRGRYR